MEVDSRDSAIPFVLKSDKSVRDARPAFWLREYATDFCEHCDRLPCECERQSHVVLNEDDVRKHYAATPSGQPTYECGWCGETLKTRDVERAVRWALGGEGHNCAMPPLKPAHTDEVRRQPWQMRDSRPLSATGAAFEDALIGWLIKQPDRDTALRQIDNAFRTVRHTPTKSEEEPKYDRPRRGRRGLPRKMGARTN